MAKLLKFYDGFVRCPKTGMILEILKGDDKPLLCPCSEDCDWRHLEPASATEFVRQNQQDQEDYVWIMPPSDEIQ